MAEIFRASKLFHSNHRWVYWWWPWTVPVHWLPKPSSSRSCRLSDSKTWKLANTGWRMLKHRIISHFLSHKRKWYSWIHFVQDFKWAAQSKPTYNRWCWIYKSEIIWHSEQRHQSMASSTKPACEQVFCCVSILNLLLKEYLAWVWMGVNWWCTME